MSGGVFYGTDANDNTDFVGGPEYQSMYGGRGNDRLAVSPRFGPFYIEGGQGNDFLYVYERSLPQDGEIYGGEGNDTIFGQEGTDNLYGGSGDDYVVASPISGSSTFLPVFIDGGQGSDRLFGSAGADVIYGGDGDDSGIRTYTGYNYYRDASDVFNLSAGLFGGFGADYLDGGRGDDDLAGEADADVLIGGEGSDRLDGGTGADRMSGGTGNDSYVVDDAGDRIVEAEDEGTDVVRSSVVSIAGFANVDYMTLEGTANLNATGNGLANILTGNGGRNVLTGGAGSDIYVIGAGDQVVEAANAGIDTVVSTVSYTAAVNVENVTLQGTSAINATGNDLANVLTGNGAVNALAGRTGNDTYTVQTVGDRVIEADGAGTDTVYSTVSFSLAGQYAENLILVGGSADLALTGNALNNTLTGNAGANRLGGGGGADRMSGGGGDDTYVSDGGDVITEALGGGTDTVESSASLRLSAHVENLKLTGSGAINGTGNDLGNVLTGNARINVLSGLAGNDTYYIQTNGDRVSEGADAGTDTVYAMVSATLSANVENLILDGAAAISGTGNTARNEIVGNAKANRIEGGQGDDNLRGGDGADTFVFHAGSGRDTIQDFAPGSAAGHDVIQFDRTQYADFDDVMAHATMPFGPTTPITHITDENGDLVALIVRKSELVEDNFLFV